MACTAPDGSTSLRSRVLVNGAPSSLRVLRQLGELLVDVNGQHAALGLRDAPTQLALLDRVAGADACGVVVDGVGVLWRGVAVNVGAVV